MATFPGAMLIDPPSNAADPNNQSLATIEIAGKDYQGVILSDASGNTTGDASNPLQTRAADTIVTGSIAANGGTVVLPLGGSSDWAVEVSGIWAGTLVIERSVDGTNWRPINAAQVGVGALQQNIVGNGSWVGYGGANHSLRLRATAWTSGSATVTMRSGIGSGAVYHVAPLVSGNNFIGHTDPTITRLPWHLYVDALLPVAGDALVTTQRVENISGTTAPTAATAHLVPAGYRLRITSGNISVHTAGTAQFNIGVRLRINTAGAAALTSPIYAMARAGLFGNAAPIANAAGPAVPFVIPNGGIEIPPGGGYAVSQVGVGTLTSTAFNLSLTGYLYPA